MPVVVAGEAWIRNKGLTLDATSPRQYLDILETLPNLPKLTGDKLSRARKYAYHFFFRRMIPLRFVVPGEKKVYDLSAPGLSAFAAGTSCGLDVICDGILDGRPFIFPAERVGIEGWDS
jgi:hypothetical protein